MEFGFSKEQERLRKEVHDFFINELPEDFSPHITTWDEELQSFQMELQKKVAKIGWTTAGWPKEYGGMGLSLMEQGIINEEQEYLGVHWPTYHGFGQVGSAVLVFGTKEQKEKFLPPITKGDVIWFQTFTEPEAGSDEANQQTRAVEDGDDYIINGQKRFISHSHKPTYLYTLTRTADVIPKHRGLSIFLVPGDAPGITYHPLPGIDGGAQNEIFFDDVRVPKENLIGQLNRGFYHAMGTFEFERAGTHRAAGVKRDLDEFVQFCKEEKRNGKPLIEDPEVRRILARRAVEVEVIRLAGWVATWRSGERERLGPAPASISSRFFLKIFSDHWHKETTDIIGLYGQLKRGSKWAKHDGLIEKRWLTGRSMHGGGTIEIYKNVAAQRGLGLPRIPPKLNTLITQALEEVSGVR